MIVFSRRQIRDLRSNFAIYMDAERFILMVSLGDRMSVNYLAEAKILPSILGVVDASFIQFCNNQKDRVLTDNFDLINDFKNHLKTQFKLMEMK